MKLNLHPMINKLSITILLIILSFSAFSQILNIDRVIQLKEQYKDGKSTYVSFSSDYALISQENDLSSFTMKADFTYLFEENAVSFISDFNLAKSNETDLVNRGYAQMVYRYNFNAKVTPEFITQYQWDGPLGMSDRYLAGCNSRFKIQSDSLRLMILAAGIMYEREEWVHPITAEPIPNRGIKINTYLNYTRKFNDNFTIGFMTYLQTKINKDIIYPRISPSLQMNFKVNKTISYVASVIYVYDTKPVIPIRNYHYNISNGFKFSF